MSKHIVSERLPEALKEAIRQARIVSFDIFDTALIRATEKPVDIFTLLAHETGIGKPRDFARARIEAEARARHIAWQERGAVEITLAEIYACLADQTQFFSTISIEDLLERERLLELRLCLPHPIISEAYALALQLNKQVGFISDMYLDSRIIEQMLGKCGYDKFDFLLVSSEIGSTKANGGLYTHIREQLNSTPSEHLHIGDNMDSDVHQARNAGLNTFHVTKIADRLPDTALGKRFARQNINVINFAQPSETSEEEQLDIWRTLWRGLAAAHQSKNSDSFWYDLGYTHVGMLLLGFTLWLNEQASKDQLTHLYFLARDGHIMLEAHELLQQHGLAHCSGSYLYASRRALNIPALNEINEQACDFLVSGTTRMTVGAFLSRAGLSVTESLPMIMEAGFPGPDHRVLTGEDYGRLRALFRSLSPVLLQLASNERDILFKYFEQEKVFEQAHLGLVDIGWHGSLQESFGNLMALWGRTSQVTGYYLGTFAAAKSRVAAGARQRAYLCEGGDPIERFSAIRASVEVFEWIFCAPHGGAKNFIDTVSGIEPVLEEAEWEKIRQNTATEMQAGALQFIRDALRCFSPGSMPPPIPANLALALIEGLLYRPMASEAKLIGDLPHAEGFGDVVNCIPIARPASKPYNVFSWPDLIRGYRRSFWLSGYKRRLWPDCW